MTKNQPNIRKCLECNKILAVEEFNTGFCKSCDPAINSPLDEEINAQSQMVRFVEHMALHRNGNKK